MVPIKRLLQVLTGAQRVKKRRADGVEAAGLSYTLTCKGRTGKGKPTWGPWGSPDEYVYGGEMSSKYVLATASVNDTEWVQKCSWQKRVDRENKIQLEKGHDHEAGVDEDKVKKMQAFLRYKGQSQGAWQSVHDSVGLPWAHPAPCVPKAEARAARPWLRDVTGPMKDSLGYIQDMRDDAAGAREEKAAQRLCHVAPPRLYPAHPLAEAAVTVPAARTGRTSSSIKSGRRSAPPRTPDTCDRTGLLGWRCPQGTPMGSPLVKPSGRQVSRELKRLRGTMPGSEVGHAEERPFFTNWTGYFAGR